MAAKSDGASVSLRNASPGPRPLGAGGPPGPRRYSLPDCGWTLCALLVFFSDGASDLWLAADYYLRESYRWFALTLVFVVVPSVVVQALSFRWFAYDYAETAEGGAAAAAAVVAAAGGGGGGAENHFSTKDSGAAGRGGAAAAAAGGEPPPPPPGAGGGAGARGCCRVFMWTFQAVIHLLQLAQVWRYVHALYLGVQSRWRADHERHHYYWNMMFQSADISMLRLLESFLKSAPQLVLQLSIMVQARQVLPLQVFSLCGRPLHTFQNQQHGDRRLRAAAAAAVRGEQRAAAAAAAMKPHKERQKKAKDSGRRRAALLFLSNISLDGRPVGHHVTNGNSAEENDVGGGGRRTPNRRRRTGGRTSGTGGRRPPGLRRRRRPYRRRPVDRRRPFVANAVRRRPPPPPPPPPETPLSPVPPGARPPPSSSSSVLSPAAAPGGTAAAAAAPHLDARQRTRNTSGSPGPKAPKKVHFIRSMRQYDTRGSRIMLICAKRSLYAAFSVLPYGDSFHLSDIKMEVQRQRLSSVVTADLVPSLEGVELGAYGKTVSYAQFLYPTNALVRPRSSGVPEGCVTVPTPQCRFRSEEVLEYDPSWLSDPQWPCGRHKRVLIFASYVTTIIEYVKPSDLKKDMNELFKEKFPRIKLTLSKIRSLKREMRAMGEECSLQPVTIAMAFVYFEKLVLQGRLNKQNRKLVSAACVLLAAKISSDLRKPEVRQLIDKLEERFRINRRELIPLEFQVLVALEMGLYLPESKVMPHYRRLVQQG
ncbi:unnamed protein product [Merluccius merluccius]